MDAGIRTPLIEAFRRSDVPREVRLDAAQGQLAPRGVEQLALLMLLADDADDEVRGAAARTLDALLPETVAVTLGRSEVTSEMVRFFAGRGVVPQLSSAEIDAPVIDADDTTVWDTNEDESPDQAARDDAEMSVTQQIQQMTVVLRVRAAMKGSREMRSILVRDPNKLVASAVLSCPKLNISEVEAFARMANVTEDVLRAIAQNRAWVKNYGVALGLTRNPKTPVALSLTLLHRLVERDVKAIAADRNVPEPLRIAARKKLVATHSR
jgi:hypothetical protein